MIRKSVVATAKIIVLLFAAYTFFFVPIGRMTAFEHMRAVLATPQAQEAVESFGAAGEELRGKVTEVLR